LLAASVRIDGPAVFVLEPSTLRRLPASPCTSVATNAGKIRIASGNGWSTLNLMDRHSRRKAQFALDRVGWADAPLLPTHRGFVTRTMENVLANSG